MQGASGIHSGMGATLNMDQILLGLIASLVGALVWVVKSTSAQNAALIETLKHAVNRFELFERSENDVHQKLVETQERIIEVQEAILKAIKDIEINQVGGR